MSWAIAFSLLSFSLAGPAASPEASPLGRKVTAFSLKDYHGKEYTLAALADKKVIVLAFVGVECPLAKLYAPRLEELSIKYAGKGVAFLGVDSNRQDSVTEMESYARRGGIHFPLLKDLGNTLADQVGATRTPEVIVLDADRVVRYAGRIDDQYGVSASGGYAKPKLTRADLALAIDDLLAGKEVQVARTTPLGCLIGRMRPVQTDSTVTYSKQISRILQRQCVDCHRPGEIAPFSLLTYEEVVGWADMIREVVDQQRMPPWHADPAIGHWRNDRRLTDEEKSQITAWVNAGAPEGDRRDLPPPRQFTPGWQIPEPDKVVWITEKPVPIPAEGTIPYKYFTVDPGFKEDVWVKLADCRTVNPSVVHHIICFVQEPGVKGSFTGNEPVNVWLLHGYAPGMPALRMPDGMAFHIRAGSKLIFQMHYTANGTATSDRSCLGLCFADPKEVRHNCHTEPAMNAFFQIPAGDSNYEVESFFKFHRDMMLTNLMPHMHLRGKSFRYDVIYPDGTTETLLNVPKYDFNWQNVYYFAEPKRVPAGSKLHCVAHFDNSEENLANPDPSQPVRWGDQTWEEMMIGWFTGTTDVEPSSQSAESRTARFVARATDLKKQSQKGARGAKIALASDEKFRGFGKALLQAVPQVDRVCVAKREGDTIRFHRVHQTPVFDVHIGKSGATIPATGMLATCLDDGKSVSIDRLATRPEPDLKKMSGVLASSYHVPVTINGEPAVVSFWSREPGAFPPPAQAVLTEIAHQLAK